MSRKKLLFIGVTLVVCLNGSVFGFLFLKELFREPTQEEQEAQKDAERQARLAEIYAKLPPLEAFKSKKDYLLSMGEAIDLCEQELHKRVTARKSWEVNMIESRHKPEDEMYLIFLYYETVATSNQSRKEYSVTCEVSQEKRIVNAWAASETEDPN